MIAALFNDSNYLAAKKWLDVAALRHEAIASNIANVETPGYRRMDLAPAFETELQRACATASSQQIAALQPSLTADSQAVASSLDGNTVNLEREMLELSQNMLLHSFQTQRVTGRLNKLRLAITGKA